MAYFYRLRMPQNFTMAALLLTKRAEHFPAFAGMADRAGIYFIAMRFLRDFLLSTAARQV